MILIFFVSCFNIPAPATDPAHTRYIIPHSLRFCNRFSGYDFMKKQNCMEEHRGILAILLDLREQREELLNGQSPRSA